MAEKGFLREINMFEAQTPLIPRTIDDLTKFEKYEESLNVSFEIEQRKGLAKNYRTPFLTGAKYFKIISKIWLRNIYQ